MIRRLLVAISIAAAILFSGLAPVAVVHAANSANVLNDACGNGPTAQNSSFCKNVKEENSRAGVFSRDGILANIAQTIVYITGAISVVMIIIGGFKYVLSNGDPAATKSAKDTILYAIIGLVVAVSCQVIVLVVLALFK